MVGWEAAIEIEGLSRRAEVLGGAVEGIGLVQRLGMFAAAFSNDSSTLLYYVYSIKRSERCRSEAFFRTSGRAVAFRQKLNPLDQTIDLK